MGVCENHRGFIAMHLANGVWLTKIRTLLKRQRVGVPYPTASLCGRSARVQPGNADRDGCRLRAG